VWRDERACIWDDAAGEFREIAALARLSACPKVFRRGALWLAWGYEDVARRRVSVPHQSFTGADFTALLFGSVDDGRTWTTLIEVPECNILALFLGDDDALALLVAGPQRSGVLRAQLRIDRTDPARPRAERLGPDLSRTPVDGIRTVGCWIELIGGVRGSFGGGSPHGQTARQTTDDGARSWTNAPWSGFELFQRLGGGPWVHVRPYKGEFAPCRDGSFHAQRTFETPILDQRVDASGRLIVRLKNAQVWALSADGSEWTQLPDLRVPTRT
jgi:hypothetical protein